MLEDVIDIVVKMSKGSVNLGDWEKIAYFCKGAELAVELGTNIGTTAIVMSLFDKKVITIDVFEKINLIEDEKQREVYRTSFGHNQHYYTSTSFYLYNRHDIEVRQDLSYKAANKFEDNSVDFLFIDADHSYNGVKKDFEAWCSKVKKNGFFAFHDVYQTFNVYKYYKEVLMHDTRLCECDHYTIGPNTTKIFKKIGE